MQRLLKLLGHRWIVTRETVAMSRVVAPRAACTVMIVRESDRRVTVSLSARLSRGLIDYISKELRACFWFT